MKASGKKAYRHPWTDEEIKKKQQKENDAALKELTSKNEELKEQIAALQEQLAQNNEL